METPSLPRRTARRPDYQRITRELRDEIIAGRFAAGTRLPSTEELALRWRSSVYTVHTALAALAKEGWIERIHGAGTYVAESANRFTCAAIYHETDIGSNRLSGFVRTIHDCLLDRLETLKKETRIFIDSRPAQKRGTLLPPLAEAIQERQVQCVIAPTATSRDSPALDKLAVPTAFAGNPGSLNRVDFDKTEFFREGVRCLARQGCRTIGLTSPDTGEKKGLADGIFPFAETFRDILREEGLATRSGWIFYLPKVGDVNLEHEGYRAFQRLWRMRHKPEGMLVYPDTLAQGVITAILHAGADAVTSGMKFAFHRNAHQNLLCPFAVTWGISDEDLLARHLVQIIEKQFRGEPVTPTLLPYEFKFDDGLRWK